MRLLWFGTGKLECLGTRLDNLLAMLRQLDLGNLARWRPGGIDTTNHWGDIHLYWGDKEARLLSDLLPDERVLIADALEKANGQRQSNSAN